VVQATGWGKSAVYTAATAATAALRELGVGPTLVVSPLLALMRDQIAAASRPGCGGQPSALPTSMSGRACSTTCAPEDSTCCLFPRSVSLIPGLRRPAAGPAQRVRPAGDR
jgi:hypothetical protein